MHSNCCRMPIFVDIALITSGFSAVFGGCRDLVEPSAARSLRNGLLAERDPITALFRGHKKGKDLLSLSIGIL